MLLIHVTKQKAQRIFNMTPVQEFTVAGEVENDNLNIGIAFTSSKDHYNKKMGRSIAYGRAQRHPYLTIPRISKVCEKEAKTIHQIFFDIAKEIATSNKEEFFEAKKIFRPLHIKYPKPSRLLFKTNQTLAL